MSGAPYEGKQVTPQPPEGQGLPLPVFSNDMLLSGPQNGVYIITYRFRFKEGSEAQVVSRIAMPEEMMDNFMANAAQRHLARAARKAGLG